MSNRKLYKEIVHGITVRASNKQKAWMILRNECARRGKSLPKESDVVEIKARLAQ